MSKDPVSDPTTHYSSDTGAADAIEVPPELIGRYRVECFLGKGGCGVVYLGNDEELSRRVAIKVPLNIYGSERAALYLREARTVAQLDHPNIVPVFDIGESEGRPFIVSKYIEGLDLAKFVRSHGPSVNDRIAIIATIAEALHFAHTKGIIHRDVKPGNIRVTGDQTPYLLDFGLALVEDDFFAGKMTVGTPRYMSPEQIRGEVHRIDGRTDIFSLGVVLYQLLVDRHPFRGRTRSELLHSLASGVPRPLRQVNGELPQDLERICLKCLANRASDRYNTAADLAAELARFLSENREDRQAIRAPHTLTRRSSSIGDQSSLTGSDTLRVIPKGLRSFEKSDSEYFLSLLPGPRDHHGQPDSLRFWLSRIQERDADATFTVGLLYGPSGSGKSSMIKAGLLPLLSADVVSIYLEATPNDTETTLKRRLRHHFPSLPPSDSLHQMLILLRKDSSFRSGRKVLIVVDQFEQWLHGRHDFRGELAQAMRQANGMDLQFILTVRDDFWLALSRFMHQLEVRVRDGENSAFVDAFDVQHARNVLEAFGRAYGRLPEHRDEMSGDQRAFVKQSIRELARDGKVACIQLAILAETMRYKEWTLSTLKRAGGISGIEQLFLEASLNSASGPRQHRDHKATTRHILESLLPVAGETLKGKRRSLTELASRCGCDEDGEIFRSAVEFLDNELRLITPSEPDSGDTTTTERFYQLSHDYLVPSIREWLTGKRKSTYKGRAQLKLEEYAGLWGHRAERRFLPGFVDLLSIRLWTRPAEWNDTQSRMMRDATRSLLRRCAIVLAAGLLLGMAGVLGVHRVHTQMLKAQVDQFSQQIWSSEWKRLPELIRESEDLRPAIVPSLNDGLADGSLQRERRARAAVFLGPDLSPGASNYSRELLDVPLKALPLATERLDSFGRPLAQNLLETVRLDELSHEQRLAYGVLLAALAPAHDEWPSLASMITGELIAADPLDVGTWVELLLPVGHHLAVPLESEFHSEDANRRAVAASALQYFIRSAPDAYSEKFVIALVLNADQRQYPFMLSTLERIDNTRARIEFRDVLGLELPLEESPGAAALLQKKANACGALYFLGEKTPLWDRFKHSEDPRLRTQLIATAKTLKIPLSDILRQLELSTSEAMSYALILALESYVSATLRPEELQYVRRTLERIAEQSNHGGICYACMHLLSVLSGESRAELATNSVGACELVGQSDHRMIRIAAPGAFEIGSPVTERGRDHKYEAVCPVEIDHDFAISAFEVTASQLRRYDPDFQLANLVAPHPQSPATGVSAYDAMKYCRWLSEALNLPEEEMCYPTLDLIGPEMTLVPDFYLRTGFRLPLEREWEFVARAGTKTSRFFGYADQELEQYACFALNSKEQTRSVGSFRPNPLGLFDIYGNVAEWCHVEPARRTAPDFVSRGGSYRTTPRFVRSASVMVGDPGAHISFCGFRIARTVRVD